MQLTAISILWVAAHHGLRSMGIRRESTRALWPLVHEITKELDHPPAPGTKGMR
jgi:hypothetical protein